MRRIDPFSTWKVPATELASNRLAFDDPERADALRLQRASQGLRGTKLRLAFCAAASLAELLLRGSA